MSIGGGNLNQTSMSNTTGRSLKPTDNRKPVMGVITASDIKTLAERDQSALERAKLLEQKYKQRMIRVKTDKGYIAGLPDTVRQILQDREQT